MLYDALFCADLPFTLGPPVPVSRWVALAALARTGRPELRLATCALPAVTVLARCYAALREVGAQRVEVRRDGDALFEVAVVPDDDASTRFPERLPPEWAHEPAAFVIVAPIPLPDVPLAAVVHLRHLDRFRPETGALVGSVRVVWTPPAEHPDPAGALPYTLRGPEDAQELARRLRGHGDALVARVVAALGQAVGPAQAAAGRIVVVYGAEDDPSSFTELLRGLPVDVALMAAVSARCADLGARVAAIDPRGVPGRRTQRGFVPSAEVTDV